MGKLFIRTGNIVDEKFLEIADAIVNPTNPTMRCGAGVSAAIFKKAGVDILEEYTEKTFGISYYNEPGKNEMKASEVRVTPGFGLPCDIIFAQGPKKWEYEDYTTAEKLLFETYKNIFMTAWKKRYKNILLPALGTGSYGFSHEKLASELIPFICRTIRDLPFNVYYILSDEGLENLYSSYLIYKK